MTGEKVHVEFTVGDGKREAFIDKLCAWSNMDAAAEIIQGFRADDYVSRRQALVKFVDEMEVKLRRNEHKRNWREKPVEALISLMMLEVKEFEVAHEFFTVDESRRELVDIANFALICWDRLGMLVQNKTYGEQLVDKIAQARANIEEKTT